MNRPPFQLLKFARRPPAVDTTPAAALAPAIGLLEKIYRNEDGECLMPLVMVFLEAMAEEQDNARSVAESDLFSEV